MDNVEALPKRRGLPRWLVPLVGYGISALSLYWVFSKFPFAQMGEHLRTMDWWWAGAAISVEVGVYVVDAWRWKVLLRPVGSPGFLYCVQAVFVGLFANDILPARAGELIRCFLLSYKTEVPLSLALTSDFIMRIMDGLWIVILYLLITSQVASHTIANWVMWVFGGSVVAVSLLLLWVLFHRQHAHHFVRNTGWAARFIHLLEEIHRLGHWRELGQAMAVSGLYWAGQVFALWAVARADGFYFNGSDIAFLLVVKTVWTLIPNAPANVGTYQATIFYVLTRIFLTEPANAKILSEIMFGLQTLPPLICGAIAIGFAGFNLGDLHRHAHHAHSVRRLSLKRKQIEDRPKAS